MRAGKEKQIVKAMKYGHCQFRLGAEPYELVFDQYFTKLGMLNGLTKVSWVVVTGAVQVHRL